MRRVYLVRKAIRNLLQNKSRTILTSLAVMISSFVLILALAAGEGARQYSNHWIGANINPNAIYIARDRAVIDFATTQNNAILEYHPDMTLTRDGEIVRQMTEQDLKELENHPDLAAVRPRPTLDIKYMQVEGSDKKFVAPVIGYDSTLRYNVAAGNLPPLGTSIEDDQIVIPLRFAEIMVEKGVVSKPGDLVGKKIALLVSRHGGHLTDEQIAKAYERGGADAIRELTEELATKRVELTVRALSDRLSSISTWLTSTVQISVNTLLDMKTFVDEGTDNHKKYTIVSAIVKNGKTPEQVKESLIKLGFAASTARDVQAFLFIIFGVLEAVVIGFGLLVLIAAIAGIVNTQYISVLERRHQIGLMKALGMRSSDVAKLFRYEAAWIALIGGLAGLILARITIFIINPIITDTLSLVEGERLLIFQPFESAIVILALILIAILAGYMPARKASRLDPVQALRNE